MAAQTALEDAMALTNIGAGILVDTGGANQASKGTKKKKKYRAGKKVRKSKERKAMLAEGEAVNGDLPNLSDLELTNSNPLILRTGAFRPEDKLLAPSLVALNVGKQQLFIAVRAALKGSTKMESSWRHTTAIPTARKLPGDAHKLICKHHRARKHLYRAGETVQAAWYAYRERLFDILIEKIEKKGEDIYIWEGQYKLGQILAAFPTKLVTDLKDKQGILTFLACSDGIGYMHNMMKRSLQEICFDVKEILVLTKGSKRKVAFRDRNHERDETDWIHEILKVTLKDGSIFAFDITGAQYGHYETVFPWDQYSKDRIRQVTETREFGQREQWLKDSLQARDTIQAAIRLTHEQAVKCLNASTDKWLGDHKTTLGDLLKSPKEVYQHNSANLLAYIAKEVAFYMDQAEKRGGVVKVRASWV